MPVHFHKYQALGNDLLVIDPATFDPALTPAVIRLLCDRHLGLGADGLCYGPLLPPKSARAMRFFNPDGSESGKSGNGLRVFARYLWDQGYISRQSPHFEIAIGAEHLTVTIHDAAARTITTALGRLSFNSLDLPMLGPARQVIDETWEVAGQPWLVTAVSVGNPHCVIFSETVSPAAIRTLGPHLETDPRFPERTNVQLVRVLDRHTIEIEIWERGAGYTLASGSSASATAGAALKTGRCDSPVTVRMAGGPTTVAVAPGGLISLTGTVEAVGWGYLAPDLLAKFDPPLC